MVDDRLEALSDAQKHLLRMGPENSRKIQKSLREMDSVPGCRRSHRSERIPGLHKRGGIDPGGYRLVGTDTELQMEQRLL